MPPLRLERVVLVDDRVAPPPVREAPFFKPPNDFILANKPPFLLVVLVVPVVAVAADEEAAAVLGSVRRLLLPTLWGVDGVDRYLERAVELLFVVVVVLARLRSGLFKGLSFSTKPSNVTFLLPSLVFNTGEEAAHTEVEDSVPVRRAPVLPLFFLLSFHCCNRSNRLICAVFFKIPFPACRCLFLQGVCFMGVVRAVLVREEEEEENVGRRREEERGVVACRGF